MKYKLYTLDNQFISTVDISNISDDFTGIVENKYGSKFWYFNGKFHRIDGPAVEWGSGGTKEWYLNGKRHRLDGPAIEHSGGPPEYWINGKYVSKEQHNILFSIMKLKGML